MKDIKCPICGEKYFFESLVIKGKTYSDTYIVPQCKTCKYKLEVCDSRAKAEKTVEEFVFRLPPIMRIKVGDKIMVDDGEIDIISEVDKINSSFRIAGYEPSFFSTEVTKWPWELKQEGE